MQTTVGYKLDFTEHAKQQLTKKNIEMSVAEEAFSEFEKVYPNKKYPGQFRVVGKGICLIGKPIGHTFKVFTAYEDGVLTPPREDQLNTDEGKAYAELYARAQKTGKVTRKNEYYPRAKQRRRVSDVRHTNVR